MPPRPPDDPLRRCQAPGCARGPLPPRTPGRPGLHKAYHDNACACRAARARKYGLARRGLIELYEGDALAWLPSLPAEMADCVHTDPPYVNDAVAGRFPMLPASAWSAIFAEFYRILRPDRVAFVWANEAMRPIFDREADAAGFRVLNPCWWDKLRRAGRAQSEVEYICRYAKGLLPEGFDSKPRKHEARPPWIKGISTPKPVPVIKILLEQATSPGQVVLDPFCGGGSTAKAARDLRLRVLTCELAPAILAIASDQLGVAPRHFPTPI